MSLIIHVQLGIGLTAVIKMTQSHSQIKYTHLIKVMVQIHFSLKFTKQVNERANAEILLAPFKALESRFFTFFFFYFLESFWDSSQKWTSLLLRRLLKLRTSLCFFSGLLCFSCLTNSIGKIEKRTLEKRKREVWEWSFEPLSFFFLLSCAEFWVEKINKVNLHRWFNQMTVCCLTVWLHYFLDRWESHPVQLGEKKKEKWLSNGGVSLLIGYNRFWHLGTCLGHIHPSSATIHYLSFLFQNKWRDA